MAETWSLRVREGRRTRLLLVENVERVRNDGKPCDAGDALHAAFRQKIGVPMSGIIDVEKLELKPKAEAERPQATGFMAAWRR